MRYQQQGQFGMFFTNESWLKIAKALPKNSDEKFQIIKNLGLGVCPNCDIEFGNCGEGGMPNFCPECGNDNIKRMIELGYL